MFGENKSLVRSGLIIFGIVGIAYLYQQALDYVPVIQCPVVNTSLGSVQGYTAVSRNGREYFAYVGIPFAQPPVGDLRFEPPQVAKPWEGIKHTIKFGSNCAQRSLIIGLVESTDEDCLFLNVYSPARNLSDPSKRFSVMVFFYGGMFMEGKSSAYGPQYFLDEDIVLVTVNYRVGAFGFLNTGDGIVRGNMGLKDQNAGLRWVQQNINFFGGKPDDVTIFGQSAGAASVHYHMLSPMSKGLFSKGISQSGVALNPWALTTKPREQAFRLGGLVNCPNSSTEELVDCLKKVSVHDILATHKEAMSILRDPITIYTPSIETVQDSGSFLTEHPVELLKSGRFTKVPWLTGVTSHEGLIASSMLIRNKSLTEGDLDNWKSFAKNGLYYSKENVELTEEVKQYFFGNAQRVEDLGIDLFFKNITSLFSDRHFFMGFVQAIRFHAAHAPTFAYFYNYTGAFTLTHVLLAASDESFMLFQIAREFVTVWFKKTILGIEPPNYGVCHVDDLFLFFDLSRPFLSIHAQHKDYDLSLKLIKLWATFAQSEIPTKDIKFEGINWDTVDFKDKVEDIKYLVFSNTGPTLAKAPLADRLEFWFDRENRF